VQAIALRATTAKRMLACFAIFVGSLLVLHSCFAMGVDPSTLSGKLIMGYQGWFACPEDGSGLGWGHWTKGTEPAVDMLPDVTDLPDTSQCGTK
jgi:hypothetical protein